MQHEMLEQQTATEGLLQLDTIENVNQFEEQVKTLDSTERMRILLKCNPQVEHIQKLVKDHPEKILFLTDGYGDDDREHIIFNDRDQDISIRITPEGYIDVLTQLNPSDVDVLNATDFRTVKDYADRLQEEEPPLITVTKKHEGYRLVMTAEDSFSGGSHRVAATRYAGNEKMWVFLRLTDSEGYAVKLFRDDTSAPKSIKENFEEFIEAVI